jgi:hypothetical protein
VIHHVECTYHPDDFYLKSQLSEDHVLMFLASYALSEPAIPKPGYFDRTTMASLSSCTILARYGRHVERLQPQQPSLTRYRLAHTIKNLQMGE